MRAEFDVDKLRFAQRQRLTYIESVAYWEGKVDRPRVCSAFNVSENHVTKDFRLYKEAYPENLRYDESSRVYRPTRRFRPRIGKGSPDEYLSFLRGQAERHDGSVLPESMSAVVTDAVPSHRGTVAANILNTITRSISGGHGMEISYQSKTRDEPTLRRVWPHALLFGGTRWHARAYDQERNEFIDLVLQRILEAKPLDEEVGHDLATADEKWARWVEIDVIPRRSFSATQAEAVGREYGMVRDGRRWKWAARMRECLAGYFIYLHRLDIPIGMDPNRVIELSDATLVDRYLAERSRGLMHKSSRGVR